MLQISSTPLVDLRSQLVAYSRSLKGKDWDEQQRLANAFSGPHNEYQRAVEKLFGELNGWQVAETSFTPDALGHVAMQWDAVIRDWMDHYVCYRANNRNVAIVGQPYGHLDSYRADLDACAAGYGLRWHVPPQPYASIHYPGYTLFIVMTVPAVTTIQWLPEQVHAEQFAVEGG